MTCYPSYTTVPLIGICNLIRWKLAAFKTTSTIFELQILLLWVQLTFLSSLRVYVKFHLRNYYDHSFHEYTSLGSTKKTCCLNPMRYRGVFIGNSYCYWFLSIVVQFIWNIWSAYNPTHKSKSLLTLSQTQYSLKVKR